MKDALTHLKSYLPCDTFGMDKINNTAYTRDIFLYHKLKYKIEYVKSRDWEAKEHEKEIERLIPTKED